jgi:hypothetical protein
LSFDFIGRFFSLADNGLQAWEVANAGEWGFFVKINFFVKIGCRLLKITAIALISCWPIYYPKSPK